MRLPNQAPVLLTRQISALILSLFISGLGLGLTPSPVKAFGVDAGSISATGGLSDCADSGVLVAFAGAQQKKLGVCPLKHTDVKANVSGYVARVTVKQQFHNPYKNKIEAVYTFPLPENAAVDEMTMKIGNRVIKGSIKKREEARQTYEAAKARGNVASLLDQERPNIFTQSVANIEPGENIDIEIKYVNLLRYEDGAFSFEFPTVVGPRFNPGNVPTGRTGVGVSPDTDIVHDASKITPPVKAEGERAGHDISIDLDINAGVPIKTVKSKLHDVDIDRPATNTAHIKLKDRDKIPNKDFVAVWNVAADAVQSGYLTHCKGNDGFFTMMLLPPKKVTPETVQPKEMIFVIDCSGSQAGAPIQKAKETMEYILGHMNPADSFQVITFNGGVTSYPAHPQVASASMKADALSFIHGINAYGGTWMAPAVEAACNLPNEEHKLRIITFMTDGYVGNDMEIIGMIKKYRGNTRWFSFGTGNSVNRFLIDNIAKAGGGEADYVLLNSSAEEVGKKFYDRISSPVLTDIKVDIQGIETKEVFPKELADLWAQKPLCFTGRYNKPGSGKVVLTGYSGGKPYRQEMKVDFPAQEDANDVLPSIWARAKVDRLMFEDWQGVQLGTFNKELKDEVVETALKYHIMSQFTSFIAVEEDRKTAGGHAKTVAVPVEMPEGVQVESTAYMHPRQKNRGGRGWSSGPISPGAFLQSGSSVGTVIPAPVSSYGSGGGYGNAGNVAVHGSLRSGGLPPSSMGKFVHHSGDNLYAPNKQTFAKAGKEMQIVDNSPVIRDFRESKVDASSLRVVAPSPTPSMPVPSSKPSSKASSDAPSPLAKSNESARLEAKLDGKLRAIAEKASKDQAVADKHLKDGKLGIRIELIAAPDAALLEQLRKLGFELKKQDGKFVFGKIEAKNLSELIKLLQILRIKLDN